MPDFINLWCRIRRSNFKFISETVMISKSTIMRLERGADDNFFICEKLHVGTQILHCVLKLQNIKQIYMLPSTAGVVAYLLRFSLFNVQWRNSEIYVLSATREILLCITILKLNLNSMTSLNIGWTIPLIMYNFIQNAYCMLRHCISIVPSSVLLWEKILPLYPSGIVFGRRPNLGRIWLSCVCLTIDMGPGDNGWLGLLQSL